MSRRSGRRCLKHICSLPSLSKAAAVATPSFLPRQYHHNAILAPEVFYRFLPGELWPWCGGFKTYSQNTTYYKSLTKLLQQISWGKVIALKKKTNPTPGSWSFIFPEKGLWWEILPTSDSMVQYPSDEPIRSIGEGNWRGKCPCEAFPFLTFC